MVVNRAMTFAVSAVCLAAIVTGTGAHSQAQQKTVTIKHAPVASPGDVSDSWSPQRNVIEGKQYERLLRTNPAFRQARMKRECGPITDPQLRQSCLSSFK